MCYNLNNVCGGRMKDEIETILKIGGKVVPFASLIGSVMGYFSKKEMNKNIEYLGQRLENIEVTIGEITEEEERNFTFRIADVVNKAIKERRFEKIDMFSNLIKNGIIENAIFEEGEEIDKYIDLLSQLHLEDIEFLENFYNKTKYEPRLHIGKNEDKVSFRSVGLRFFETLYTLDGTNHGNHNGFKENAISILHKCIANGLVKQNFNPSELMDEVFKMDRNGTLNTTTKNLDSNLGFEYSISELYFKMRNYLENN